VVQALPRAWADAPALRRAWTELIRNSLAFARPGEGAHLRIHGEPGASEHVFGIDDQGIGWEPGDEERIFEPMERLAPRADRAGTGLGLFVARQTVLRLGGRMWAEAEPGQGARLRFSLPAAPPIQRASGRGLAPPKVARYTIRNPARAGSA
jgi:signal transduction histidine kinase